MQQHTNTALLVMDMQMGILGNFPGSETLITNVKKSIDAARSNNIPVIYVVVGFRQGAPEISANNKGFGGRRDVMASIDMTAFMQVHPDIAPSDGELTVTKRRVSAFTGSDLEVVLRSFGISHIILTGIATSGVVLSTVREAADKDYRISVLADCCADPDPEVHSVLVEKVFPRQADVMTLEEWLKM